ncbi:uncharacterized protein LOC131666967 [Phymastichus coffea]|uniref:uncharacterized protein LOC131666967 n=1 Tax=Phymastichus coffea TaxID=108790 RepID=UPI00273BF164|nr:uncharacterized protein LOC131666967 [Phymastichus coffea]
MAEIISEDLKIVFWNCRSIRARIEEIPKILQKIDILVCVESWLNDQDKGLHFPSFKTIRIDRMHKKGGGIVIFITNNLVYVQIHNLVSPSQAFELLAFEITNITPKIVCHTYYRAPGSDHTQNEWNTIFNNINPNQKTIVMGDFNAHHTFWNCGDSDNNGECLFLAHTNSDTFLHNFDSHTYIRNNSNYFSNLDLIFSSNNVADKINVLVNDETWGSDHFPIFIDVHINKNTYRKKTFNVKSTRTDWAKVTSYLDNNYVHFLSYDFVNAEPNYKYSTFTDVVANAIKTNTPVKRVVNNKVHRNPVSWWDYDCDKVIRLRRAAFKKWRFSKNQLDFFEYKKASALARKTFKTKKRANFRNFAESLNFSVNQTYVWNKSKLLKNKWIKITPNSSHENHQNFRLINDCLDRISPSWCANDPNNLPNCQLNPLLESLFNFAEFNASLSNKNTRSSFGVDGLDYEAIQRLPLKYKLLLVDIFNDMYQAPFPMSGKSLTFISSTSLTVKALDPLRLAPVSVKFSKPCSKINYNGGLKPMIYSLAFKQALEKDNPPSII